MTTFDSHRHLSFIFTFPHKIRLDNYIMTMARRGDACQSGWAEEDLTRDIGLFTLYQGGHILKAGKNLYQPHKRPFRTLPHLEERGSLEKEKRSEEKEQSKRKKGSMDTKVIFNHRSVNKRGKKELIGRIKSEVVVDRKEGKGSGSGTKPGRVDNPIKIKNYSFEQMDYTWKGLASGSKTLREEC